MKAYLHMRLITKARKLAGCLCFSNEEISIRIKISHAVSHALFRLSELCWPCCPMMCGTPSVAPGTLWQITEDEIIGFSVPLAEEMETRVMP